MYDYEKALEDKKFKIKDYILWTFAGLGLIFFLSVLFHGNISNGNYIFISPSLLADRSLKEAYLIQCIVILATMLLVLILYSKVILKLEGNEKFPPALVDLIFLLICVGPFFIMFYALGFGQTASYDAKRIAITTFIGVIVLEIRTLHNQVKVMKKVNQRLKKNWQ